MATEDEELSDQIDAAAELACMQEIETHLQGYYDEELSPNLNARIKKEMVEILLKYYPAAKEQFTVDVFQLEGNKLSVAISPKGQRQCPKCLNKKLWSYTLDTQPPTINYNCECGWEGQLA